MRLLLDTCSFLWLTMDPPRVSSRVSEIFRTETTLVYFSAASGWEIAIKHKLGRLDLPEKPGRYIPRRIAQYRLEPLDMTLAHVIGAGALPLHHNDPFDRLLIAQAEIEDLVIATPDRAFEPYGARTLW